MIETDRSDIKETRKWTKKDGPGVKGASTSKKEATM